MLTKDEKSSLSPFPKPKVLIADDDKNCRSLLNILLSEKGWEVIEAEDGIKAVLLIEENLFDLLVADALMPNLSGIEVCQLLAEKGINIAVILLSGLPDLSELAESVGVTYFLPKPFDFSKFLNLVELAKNSRF